MKQSVSEAKRSVNWSGFPHALDHILCQVCRIELVQHLTSFYFLMAVTLFLVTKTLWNAIYRQPRTSKPAPGHRVYPYLLGGMDISRTKQVWAADITYIPMAKGFLYLVAIMDLYSRYVVAWKLSNTLDADSCSCT